MALDNGLLAAVIIHLWSLASRGCKFFFSFLLVPLLSSLFSPLPVIHLTIPEPVLSSLMLLRVIGLILDIKDIEKIHRRGFMKRLVLSFTAGLTSTLAP